MNKIAGDSIFLIYFFKLNPPSKKTVSRLPMRLRSRICFFYRQASDPMAGKKATAVKFFQKHLQKEHR